MKRNRRVVIFILLFSIYMFQGFTLFINSKKVNSSIASNSDLDDISYDIDVTDVIAQINGLGFDIDNLKKDNNKINVSAFINSSKEDILFSLENLREFKCFIDDYEVIKDKDIDVRFNLRIQ